MGANDSLTSKLLNAHSASGRRRALGFCGIGVLLVVLSGCSAGGLPPVSDRSRATSLAKSAGDYVVVAGDTLYSIAWRHQRDFRELARINGIAKPYEIYPGQRLQVRGSVARRAAPTPVPTSATRQAKPETPHPLSRTEPKPQAGALSGKRALSGNRAPKKSQPPKPKVAARTPASAPQKTKPASAPARRRPSTGPVALRWPTNGKRLRGFGERAEGAQMASNSIDFLLTPGASIRAAAAGEVVYVGQALAGFEQFVIVKHNDTWLSAYGFNAASIVAEKQQLARGAVLATLGREGGSQRQRELHFEVRKNGTPVNPALVIN